MYNSWSKLLNFEKKKILLPDTFYRPICNRMSKLNVILKVIKDIFMNLILYVFIIILFLFSDFVNNNNNKKIRKKIIRQKNKYNSKLHKKTFYPSLSFYFVSYVI